MCLTRELLKGSNSEAEALSVYNKVKETGEWLSFLKAFLHDADYQVARNALWSLTKATDKELSALQPMLHELIDKALKEENPSVRRLSMNIIVRLEMQEDDLENDRLIDAVESSPTCLRSSASLSEIKSLR